MASAQYETKEPCDLNDLRIVLLGVSGAGKSSAGNAILGRDVFGERGTRESEIQRGTVEDRIISIIDTPGFFSSHLTDEELREQMKKSLDLSHPGPHVFLLVINLENFREEQRNVVEEIQEIFGAQAFKFTMVLFIGRDKFSRNMSDKIIKSEETQKFLNCFKGGYQEMNSKCERDSNQISKLVKKIDEMVKNNGGQNYSSEICLNNLREIREQKETPERKTMDEEVEQEKIYPEMKKAQAEENALKKEGKIKPEEKQLKIRQTEEGLKDKNEKKKEDVKKKLQYPKEKDMSAREDLRKQVESQKEKERQKCELEKEMKPGDPSRPADLRIVVLGKLNVGKTATANTILGRDAFRANFLTSISEKHEMVVSGSTISVIDTPGLLETGLYMLLPQKLKRDIMECLVMSAPGPHVFLLVIKINSRHTEEENHNAVTWIQENFGEDAVRHTLVLFTHVDLLTREPLDEYIKKSPGLMSLIDSCNGRFHYINNQDRDNRSQVTDLLEKIQQLVKDNKGEHYSNEKSQEAQRRKLEKRRGDAEEHAERENVLYMLGGLMGLLLHVMHNMSEDLRIVLLGSWGSGKISTGNTILGQDVFSSQATSRRCVKQEAEVFGRTISIVDTPGLCDSSMQGNSPESSEMERSLEMSSPGPHAFLLVLEIEHFIENSAVKWFQKNLEKDALKRSIVLFTDTDLLPILTGEPLNEHIEKNSELKSLISSCGGRFHFISNVQQNRRQVMELLVKIDEMLMENGGGHYTKHSIFRVQTEESSCQIQ